MAWSASKIFSAYLTDVINNVTAMDLDTDALLEAALFNDTITPSQTVASASTAYGAGVWTGSIVDTGTGAPAGWPALGRPLSGVTSGFTSNVYALKASNTVSSSTTTTLAACNGVLIYDHSIAAPVADQGICYLWFGGAASVTLGQFTVAYNAAGLMTLTL